MIDSTKCPVCGRKDIPDYHQGDVRCPECGSNLRVYRLLDKIEEDSKSKATIWKPVAIMALVAAALFAILFFTKGSSATVDKERIALLEDSIASLRDNMGTQKKPAVAVAEVTEAKDDVKPTETTTGKEDAKVDEPKEEITAPAGKVVEKDGKKIYTVQKGDSWWKISQKLYKGKIKDVDIARMNGRKASDQLEIGEQLIVK